MLRSLRLENVGPAPKMDFVPAERLNLVTGDNGLGKSFLLDLAWWAVTRTWAGRPIQPPLNAKLTAEVDIEFDGVTDVAPFPVPYDRMAQVWRFPPNQPAPSGLVVYARVDGDFAVWDSNRRFGDREEAESGIPKGLTFTREEVWNGYRLNDKPICNGLLADWVTWQQTTAWEFTALTGALVGLSPSPQELVAPGSPTRVDLLDSRLIPTLKMPYGQEVPLTVASAGMKRVVALAYLLVWAWREHLEVSRIAGRKTAERMLVIVDEVEAHLHPKWQRVILSAVMQSLTGLISQHGPSPGSPGVGAPQIQYIVATHSPLVLGSMESTFDEQSDGLFELRLEGTAPEGVVVLSQVEFRKLGDADGWLTSGLGLKSSRPVEAEKAIADAAELMKSDNPPAARMTAVEGELEKVLSDTDPFWRRWRALREGSGGS